MYDLGIGADVMDFHAVDDADFEQFGVQYFRMTQALLQAGIDIHMLTPMNRAQISAALWADNTLFEEAGALMAMFRQSYGLVDAMHDNPAEHEKIKANLDMAGASLQEMEDMWHLLTPEQQAKVQHDWDTRSKNMAVYYYEMDEQRLAGASPTALGAALAAFMAMDQLVLGEANPEYHQDRMHLIEKSRQERHVFDALNLDLSAIRSGFDTRIESIAAPVIMSSFAFKPAGYDSWEEKVKAERVPQMDTKEVPDKLPETFVEKIEQEKVLAELAVKESQLN